MINPKDYGIEPPNEALLMETAMCLWEYCIEKNIPNSSEWPEGCGQMRLCCAALAPAAHTGWELAVASNGGDLPVCFDWDFIPWFMENCVELYTQKAWTFGDPDLDPAWHLKCKRFGEPTDRELLNQCLQAFNHLPRQSLQGRYHDTYDLAATISGVLNNG